MFWRDVGGKERGNERSLTTLHITDGLMQSAQLEDNNTEEWSLQWIFEFATVSMIMLIRSEDQSRLLRMYRSLSIGISKTPGFYWQAASSGYIALGK